MPYLEGLFNKHFGFRYIVIGSGITPGHQAIQKVCDVIAQDLMGTRLIEVKFDEHDLGKKRENDLNIFAETYSNYPQTPGWFNTCEATDLVFAFPLHRVAYVGAFPGIRNFVLINKNLFREVGQDRFIQSNEPRGLLVPVTMLVDKGLMRRHSLADYISMELVQERVTQLVEERAARLATKYKPTRYMAQDSKGLAVIASASSS